MIELNRGWRIDNSKLPELTLQENKKITVTKNSKPTGEIRYEWRDVGYYATLTGVFGGYLNHYAAGANTVVEVLARIAEVRELLQKSLTIEKA